MNNNRNRFLNQNNKLYIAPSVICIKEGHNIYIFFEDTLRKKEISKLSKKDYIKIFNKTIKGWFFEPIEALVNFKHFNFHFGFIALMSVIPYIEMKGQLLQGSSSNRQSKRVFINTFSQIFKKVEINGIVYISSEETLKKKFESMKVKFEDVNEEIVREIYEKVRNGFYHNNMFKGYVKWGYKYKTSFEIEKLDNIYTDDGNFLIKINPKIFVKDLKKDFTKYIKTLKQNEELYENFERQFLELHGKVRTCIGLANI